MTLAARLLLPPAAALLPAVALLALFEGQARQARETAVRDQALRLAALVNADLGSVADGARQTLAALGSLEAVRGGDAAACGAHLRALLPQVPRYADLLAAGLDGRVLCSALAADGPMPSVADRPYFRRALDAGGFAAGDRATGRRSGRPVVHFAQPFPGPDGAPAGVVAASLDLDWLEARLAALALPPGASAGVADRSGAVLARRPASSAAFEDRTVSADVLPLLARVEPGVAEAAEAGGGRRVLGYVPLAVEPAGFFVGVGLDRDGALAGLAGADRAGIALILAGTALALALGWATARRFVQRPVGALLRAAERWRAGDLAARAGADPALGGGGGRQVERSEFGRLAAAFDAMAEAAAERERALRENAATNARLAAIVASSAEAIIGFAAEDGRILAWNRGAEELFGYAEAEALGGPVGLLVPPDLPDGDPTGVFARALAGVPVRDHETARLAKGGERIPVSVTAAPIVAPDGRVLGVSAVFRDLRARKAAEERQLLLMREVDHRAKNVLAVVQSVLRLTRAEDRRGYAEAVEGRIAALGRAHGLLAKGRWSGAGLREVAEEALAAYRGGGRVALSGHPVGLAAEAVQPVSMVLHELATNAAKHGALSRPEGRIDLAWSADPASGGLRLAWEERGGPPVAGAPGRHGFGSTLIAATLRGQLGGAEACHWAPGGLRCEMTVAARHLRPAGPAAPEAAATVPTAAMEGDAAGAAALAGRRVLVAEDEPLVAMELARSLGALGCEVVGPAATLADALRLAAAAGPGLDAAVLDINLGGQGSFPAADLLAGSGVPVLFASGYSELPPERAGTAPLLRKPLAPGELEAALRRLVAERAADPAAEDRAGGGAALPPGGPPVRAGGAAPTRQRWAAS